MKAALYPYIKELITDAEGHILKVVMDVDDYERLLDAAHDEALLRAMQETEDETPLTKEQALKDLKTR